MDENGPMTPVRPPLTQVLPHVRDLPHEPADPLLVELYDAGPLTGTTGRARVQANMVLGVDGAPVGADGLSGSISDPADKRVFSVLRSLADAVVVGAGTIRAERYTRLSAKAAHRGQRLARGQAEVPVLVIVSASGVLDLERLDSAGTSPVLVVTSTQDPAVLDGLRSHLGEDSVVRLADTTPATVLGVLADRGFTRILTEGGPHLLGTWVAAGLVDELCLTVSPHLTGRPDSGPADLLGGVRPQSPVEAELLSTVTDGRTLIHRYALTHHAHEGDHA